MSEFFEDNLFIPNQNNWKNDALCKGMFTQDFFPQKDNKFTVAKTRTLIQMCLECPVKVECLYEACMNEDDGIWGGCSFKERVAWARSLGYKSVTSVTIDDCENFLSVEPNRHENFE